MKSTIINNYNASQDEPLTKDFGRFIKAEPKCIVRPKVIKDIQQAIVYARKHSLGLAVRGHAHTTGGQTLTDGGLVLDMTSYFNKIDKPIICKETESGSINLQAGASWHDVFKTCLESSLTPPTYSDWLHLSVGGTISTGGVGQRSYRKGLQIDNVIELEVVTGEGDIIVCSENQNKQLFDLVRGGYGHFGVITRVKMALEPAPKKVLVFKLVYTESRQFLSDQLSLAEDDEIDAIQSHVVVNDTTEIERRITTNLTETARKKLSRHETPWIYVLEVTKYLYEGEVGDVQFRISEHLQQNLKIDTSLVYSKITSFADHVTRVPPILESILEKSKPSHHHCCVYIPKKSALTFLDEILKLSTPKNTGNGTILIIPLFKNVTKAAFGLPDSDQFFLMAFLRRQIPELIQIEGLELINDMTYKRAIELDGTIYPCGSGRYLTEKSCWIQHYGERYPEIISAKKTHDPDNIFCPKMPITGKL